MAASLFSDNREERLQNGRNIWKDSLRKLIRRRDAWVGIIIILLFIILAILAPVLSPHGLWDRNPQRDWLPPFWVKNSIINLSGDMSYPLGTAQLGRDILTWLLYGTRTSIFLGFFCAPIVAIFGTLYGLISGYSGGKTDNILMRIADAVYAFPTLVVYVLVVLILRPTAIATWMNGALIMLIAFLSVNWVSIARLVRASVLKLKKLEFVEAAQSIGARPWRIIRKHILPNSMSPILVWITYSIPQFILVEAILGYLGISLSPTPDETLAFGATWGGMLREGRAIIHVQPIMTIAPAVCLALISIAFTLLGDAMRDSLDPGLNEKKEHPEI